jgi:hypothetical protein
MRSTARSLVVLCIVVFSLGAAAGPAAGQTAASGQLILELEADGDAAAVFTEEFDLTDAEQRATFRNVTDSAALRAAAAERLRGQMRTVSAEAGAGLDRELRVGNVTVETAVDGETGIVAYAFRWENLAVVDGDRIVLREPFTTYTSLDRELVVFAPEGGEITSVSPQPERRGEDVVTWPGLTRFGDGFEVVAVAPGGGELSPIDHEPSNADTYGGGAVALGVSALLVASLFLGRQQ